MSNENSCKEPLLIRTSRGFSVLYRNKYLYSKYNPQAAITAQIAALQIPDSTLILCFSPVLGYGLRELEEKLPASSYILAVECDQTLMRFSLDNCEQTLFAHRQFSYIRTDAVSEAVKKIEALPLFPFKRCIALSCSGGVQLNRQFYDTVRFYAEETISRFWKNRVTVMHLGRNYVHNIFRNLLSLTGSSLYNTDLAAVPPRRLLTGKERIRKPIVVAGAGPSLDKARDFIIKNRSAFFLLAVDAAAAALLPDIRPDAIALVESQYWIDAAFIGLKKYGIPIFADLTASPRALRAAGGAVYFFCTEYADLRYLKRLYRILQPVAMQPMGSVGLTALQLALLLTDSRLPVLHTGLDFAWQSGLTHAAGSSPARKLYTEINRMESFYKLNFPAGMQQTTGKRDASYWTTPVLTGYAELYRHIFAGNELITDIGTEGCCLTGRQVEAAEAEVLLAAASDAGLREKSGTGAGNGCDTVDAFSAGTEFESGQGGGVRQNIQAYLAEEYEQLTALSGHLKGLHSLPEQTVERILAERDYLYSHFPDAARGYSLSLGFLKRVSIELAYMLKIFS